MAVDPSTVGRMLEPREYWWNAAHCLLYALAVGCGPDELAYVVENAQGHPQQVLPTFAVTSAGAHAFAEQPGASEPGPTFDGPTADFGFGEIELAALRHGEQRIELAGPLPTAANVRSQGRVVALWDKGHAAVAETESEVRDVATGELLYKVGTSLFIKGEGGFGGDRGPVRAPLPTRKPDDQVTYQTLPTQAFLFELCMGGRPRLHTDPAFAAEAGLPAPILHGMCTYGFTGRALLHRLCGGDARRFASMSGRFSNPVFPGDALTVSIWVDGNEAQYVTETQRGDAVVTGSCSFR